MIFGKKFNRQDRKAKKVQAAWEQIASKMAEETIVFSRENFDYISKSKNTGLEIARMGGFYNPFAGWANFVIRTGKNFLEKYVPMQETLSKIAKK